jgi:hypothetical protein
MRSGKTHRCAWIGFEPKAPFGARGAAEPSRGRAALTNQRASAPICGDMLFFGVTRHFAQSTGVYVLPPVNSFAPRDFLVSNVPDGR